MHFKNKAEARYRLQVHESKLAALVRTDDALTMGGATREAVAPTRLAISHHRTELFRIRAMLPSLPE